MSGTVSDLVAKFVTDADLAGTLAWLADRSAQMPGVRATALVLADRDGALDTVAASSAVARELQELERQHQEGPCRDSYDRASRIDCPDLADAEIRWPHYAPSARRLGVRGVHAFPLPMPGRTIGAMALLLDEVAGASSDSLENAQTLANTAALGVDSHRATENDVRVDQLQTALDSRVLIEQAKGLLSERLSLTPDQAFAVLRQHTRSHHLRLRDVAAAVLDGTLSVTAHRSPR
ncbi:GAF and ANTAR domain-containing protein [Kribbella sp. NPDC050124]|uniref:GAF and ANTAR domain-containing protein n=1 Tax=Kribbella sp. NPDC050124 TaxID=3364114 RepID=UPI0037A0F932